MAELNNELLSSITQHGVVRRHDMLQPKMVYIMASVSASDSEALHYINSAYTHNPSAIIISKNLYQRIKNGLNTSKIYVVDNVQLAWAEAVAEVYKHEKLPQRISAITGTNGKTTTAYIYAQIAAKLNKKAGYVGTLGAIEFDCDTPTLLEDTLTTPDSMDMMKILSKMVKNDCDDVCIEASSHGLHQHRLAPIPLSVAAFTNFSHEHLDYHGTMEEYYHAKTMLFTHNKPKIAAVLNYDDEYAMKISKCYDSKIITYGYNENADFRLQKFTPGYNLEFVFMGQKYAINTTNIIGRYNAYNIMCAIAMIHAYGIYSIEKIATACENLTLPSGRMTHVNNEKNLKIFVDFAHKPEALKMALNAIIEYRNLNDKNAKIWLIFGCGGDRDKEKRPLMGAIATQLADEIIVTDDNPRFENSAAIRSEIIAGITQNAGKYLEISDRKAAIKHAIENMKTNDILLIAGKGHEKYQIIGDEKLPFCDSEIARDIANNM